MKRLFAIALIGALAACSSPPVPKDTFYRLDLAAPARHFQAPPIPGVLEVDRIDTDGVLAERAIAYNDPKSGGLQRYRYDFWSEAPGVLLRDALVNVLTQANAAEKVVTPDLRVPPAYSLRGKLRRFEQSASGDSVAVKLDLALVSARDGSLILQRSYAAATPAAADTPAAAAKAMTEAVGQVVDRFLGDLAQANVPAPRR